MRRYTLGDLDVYVIVEQKWILEKWGVKVLAVTVGAGLTLFEILRWRASVKMAMNIRVVSLRVRPYLCDDKEEAQKLGLNSD
jgi:hypothetical protein